MDEQRIRRFWKAVEDCLVNFHGLSHQAAAQKVQDTKRAVTQATKRELSTSHKVQQSGKAPYDDLIYHLEPFYIANNMAGTEAPMSAENMARYQEVLVANKLAPS